MQFCSRMQVFNTLYEGIHSVHILSSAFYMVFHLDQYCRLPPVCIMNRPALSIDLQENVLEPLRW